MLLRTADHNLGGVRDVRATTSSVTSATLRPLRVCRHAPPGSDDQISRVAREQYCAYWGERAEGRIGHRDLGREVICP